MEDDGQLLLTELLRVQEENACLTREIEVLRHQLQSKDQLLDSLQCAVMAVGETASATPRRGGKGRAQVVKGEALDTTAIRICKSTLTNVYQVSYGDAKDFVIQTPVASVPFGLDGAQPRRHVTLKFSCAFVDKLVDIQERVRAAVTSSTDVFVPFVRDDGNVRVALASSCCAYDAEGRAMDVANCLQPGASVECILRCNGVWHTRVGQEGASRMGLSWSLLQVRCRAAGLDVSKYAFVD